MIKIGTWGHSQLHPHLSLGEDGWNCESCAFKEKKATLIDYIYIALTAKRLFCFFY